MLTEKKENTLFLVAEEEFTIQNANAIQEKLVASVLSLTEDHVVLDLRKISFMDSIGVKLIVGLFKSCQAKKVQFRVDINSPGILKTLQICKMDQLIEIKEGA